MTEMVLDSEMINALNAALEVSKAYAEEEMNEGDLSAEQYAVFQAWRDDLDRLAAVFSAVEQESGEVVH